LRLMTHEDSVTESDPTIFESAQRNDQLVLVKLSGELDIRYRRTLENTLRDWFMDSQCVPLLLKTRLPRRKAPVASVVLGPPTLPQPPLPGLLAL
jgi:hypothetical protein